MYQVQNRIHLMCTCNEGALLRVVCASARLQPSWISLSAYPPNNQSRITTTTFSSAKYRMRTRHPNPSSITAYSSTTTDVHVSSI